MIADRYLQLRADLENALADLLKIGAELRRPAATLDTLHGLLRDVREPLLFVAVGEVKSGKSSLLNALFGQEFAKVDVLPATDKVCIFRFGQQEKQVDISPKIIERHLPIDFLKDFNVVDTPGTNTIVAEHQTITENFLPRADVVLFVFSVTNPWTQSAWDFLKVANKRWLKNVVFVLQQIDLRDEREIEIIKRHLQDTALQQLGMTPPIFPVSARKALLARTSGVDKERLWKESRLAPLEEQISLTVADSSARLTKLQSARQTGQVMLEEMTSEIRAAFDVISKDEARLKRVEEFVAARKEQTLRLVAGLVKNVEGACAVCAEQGRRMVSDEFSFWRTLRMVFTKRPQSRDFQMGLEMKLRQTIEPQVEHAVQLLEADLRGLWPQLRDLFETRLGDTLRDQLPKLAPDFARQRRELLQSIQLALAEHLGARRIEEHLTSLLDETSARLRIPAGVAAAGGIAALIAAMSSAALADITGVVAATAAAAGTFVALRQRRKIIQAYDAQMMARCVELTQAVEQQLQRAVDLFYSEITNAFQPLAAFCIAQRRTFEPMLDRGEKIRENLQTLASQLGTQSSAS